jgi:hypothetical protein
MDASDCFTGEQVLCERAVSDAACAMIARVLLGAKPVPPVETWGWGVSMPGRGWCDLWQIVRGAASNREHEDRCRYEANIWHDAYTAGTHTGATSTIYR